MSVAFRPFSSVYEGTRIDIHCSGSSDLTTALPPLSLFTGESCCVQTGIGICLRILSSPCGCSGDAPQPTTLPDKSARPTKRDVLTSPSYHARLLGCEFMDVLGLRPPLPTSRQGSA